MEYLFIIRYPESPVRIPDKGKVTIGRAQDNTIVLTEPRVSRLHAQIEWREYMQKFALVDLGSSNGTYLNNVRLASLDETHIGDRDKIRIASSVLTIRFAKDISEVNYEFQELRQRVHGQITEIVSMSEIKNITFESMKESPAIAGDLSHLCSIELFQLLESSRKTGCLKMETLEGTGSFYIQNGEILTGQFNFLQGEKAVYEALRCTSGNFEFQARMEILEEPQIKIPTTALLMEGCRLLDELKV
jgi:hypothetical protein